MEFWNVNESLKYPFHTIQYERNKIENLHDQLFIVFWDFYFLLLKSLVYNV